MSTLRRLTASSDDTALQLVAGTVTASTTSRTISGQLVIYDVYGRTSAGRLKVARGAMRFPEDLNDVILTREHERADSRGYLAAIEHVDNGIRATFKVADGPEGDAALREAKDKSRRGLSFDVVDVELEGDTIVAARVIAGGQVSVPAYDGLYIDQIAASLSTDAPQTPAAHAAGDPTGEGTMRLTPEELQELATLRALESRTAEQDARLAELEARVHEDDEAVLTQLAEAAAAAATAGAGGQQVAASLAAVAPGVPAVVQNGTGTRTTDQRTAVERFVDGVVAAYDQGNPQLGITAALADVTYAQHGGIIAQPAWSGELWSGDDEDFGEDFTELLAPGTLTALKGAGWRFKVKPEIKDYAGNKVEIPTTTIETEPTEWTAARLAVGNDFDRAFYDFPELFRPLLEGYVRFVRVSTRQKFSAKALAYILANAVPAAGVAAQPTALKAAAHAIRALKHRKVGKADWVLMNDDDHFTLFDLTKDELPAFLELFDLDPGAIKSSPDVPQGTVLAGVKKVAEFKTLPGSPIRVDAQKLTHGGVDEAFFAYWAIEEHHIAGIASVEFDPAAV